MPGLASIRAALLLLPALSSSAYAKLYSNVADLPKSHYDFVIGGAAGNVVANRLSENSLWSVLVIEAGPSNVGILDEQVPALAGTLFAPTSPYTWKYTTVPQPEANNRVLGFPRGKILGGSTGINEMWYTRGSADDFNRFARVSGDPGWGWDAMMQYFFKNEKWTPPADNHDTRGEFNPKFHSTTGMNPVSLPGFAWPIFPLVIETTKQLPNDFPFIEDYNGGNPIGLAWTQTTIGGGMRSSSAGSYLADRFMSRPNLHVLVNAQVSRVLPAKKSWIRGSAVHFNQVEMSHDFKRLSTPQILLQSGIGNSTTLKRIGITPLVDLPSVGQNLTEQPLVSNSWFANTTQSYETFNLNATQLKIDLAEWNKTKTGPLVSSSGAHVAFLRLPNDSSVLRQFGDPAAGPNTPHIELEFTAGIGLETPIPAGGGHFLSIQAAVVSSASRGSVTLNETNPSPWNLPVIDPNILAEPFDLQTMVYALRWIMLFLSAPAWNGYVMQPLDGLSTALGNSNTGLDAAMEAYIRNSVQCNQHPVGTASMAPRGASWGVVDPDLVLKKATGIRVIDASVMPFVISGHTMAPTYAFAERGSDLIKETWA